MPEGVRLMPGGSPLRLEDDPDECRFWSRSWVTAMLSLQLATACGDCQSISASPSFILSPCKIQADDFNSPSAACERDEESLPLFQEPLLYLAAVSSGSKVASLGFSVVDGNTAIVLQSELGLAHSIAFLLDMSGKFDLGLVLFIMMAPSSYSLSSKS